MGKERKCHMIGICKSNLSHINQLILLLLQEKKICFFGQSEIYLSKQEARTLSPVCEFIRTEFAIKKSVVIRPKISYSNSTSLSILICLSQK